MSKQKRVAKQYLIINEKNIRVNYGTTDRKTPSVIFARAKGSVEAVENKKTYAPDIQDLKKYFKNLIKRKINTFEALKSEKMLCNIDVAENGLSFGRKGHLRYEVFIKPSQVKKLEEYESEMKKLANDVNNEIHDFLKERGIKAF